MERTQQPPTRNRKRETLRYDIEQKDGRFETFVTLTQPEIPSAWLTPQGTRPDRVSVGRFATRGQAEQAGKEYSPPKWDGNNQNRCRECDKEFNAFKRRHHCRNCGFIVCSECSKDEWPKSMFPWTYHNKERNLRICSSCKKSYNCFRKALQDGNESYAKRIYSEGNVNLWFPYTCDKEGMYSVHYAAYGKKLSLLRWLTESHYCDLSVSTQSGELK